MDKPAHLEPWMPSAARFAWTPEELAYWREAGKVVSLESGLDRWLPAATSTLSAAATARITAEIYAEARRKMAALTQSGVEANEAASTVMQELGDPKVALLHYKKQYLTVKEAKRFETDSEQHGKNLYWLTLVLLGIFVATLFLNGPLLFFAFLFLNAIRINAMNLYRDRLLKRLSLLDTLAKFWTFDSLSYWFCIFAFVSYISIKSDASNPSSFVFSIPLSVIISCALYFDYSNKKNILKKLRNKAV